MYRCNEMHLIRSIRHVVGNPIYRPSRRSIGMMIGAILVLLSILGGSAEASIATECHHKSVRDPAKAYQFWRDTGHPRGWVGHWVDHICPLACGGLDDQINMQWQTIPDAKAKDRMERTPDGYIQFCTPQS